MRNKFDYLVQQITSNVDDTLIVSETKLDNSFPVGQFLIDRYGPPIRLDRDIHGERLMFFLGRISHVNSYLRGKNNGNFLRRNKFMKNLMVALLLLQPK